ncbi:Phosphohistidine phosphatase SixA [Saliniradius amylolyticus]|uniref:Phosphohistidine phosphatase SixA n=1 Tax=Saliniradius amylolyticus TaxID=2183582 RepID=A0A2S2E561_9ALTE|nr:phosphohistidine phosphatase SixA [Saliniradius amylolyticus]AWL12370.1 Phosphohistidine phosphatase SixA [Saliniradius amylolyticus]
MDIYIMRHGEAEQRFGEDASRRLTTRGFDEAALAGQWLKQHPGNVDLALVSPFTRAQQSFEAVSAICPVVESQTCADITPAGSPAYFHDYLHALVTTETQLKSLLLVSHMPFVSLLVDELCERPLSLLFATAGVVHLRYDAQTETASMVSQYLP